MPGRLKVWNPSARNQLMLETLKHEMLPMPRWTSFNKHEKMTSMLVHGPLQQMLGKYTTSKDGMYAPSTRTLTITCSSPALIHTTSSTFAVSVVLKEYHPWALVLMSSEKLQKLQKKGSWLSFKLAVMLRDRQWNEFAKTAFTEAVLEEMNIKGFKNEAQWCSMKHFHQACDEPCISIEWHLDIRNHLFQFAHLDISHHLDSIPTRPIPCPVWRHSD